MAVADDLRDEQYAYLTTRGRRSGRPHTIEIWFALVGRSVWMVAGGGTSSDWVANLLADPAVTVRIGSRTFTGRARTEPGGAGDAAVARRLLAARYQGWEEGRPLSDWAASGLAVAVDLDL
ncbi:MAG TPA: nitroreductase family deazaflavin-dependent oxidoreductase [Acidimicrobiales bacterium]|nr:nitroreductase family deazaflavin-dependent oxidoreductase [Acidimicrobiales bacterium]